ncbi:MAG: hypothetical protein ACYDAR_03075 [Thermomicrobiales bacterium]
MGTRIPVTLLSVIAVALLTTQTASAAQYFATPGFQQRWQQDEAILPNFWGPLATALDGRHEPYVEGLAAAICTPDLAACSNAIVKGQRTVQYFDKGRMELTAPGAMVTSGLLVREMMTGQVQTGDATFEQRAPAAVPVAGDPSNTLYYRDIAIANFIPPQIGQLTQNVLNVTAGGRLGAAMGPPSPSDLPSDPAAIITTIDAQTGHGVAQAFDAFRARVGLDVVGLALTEPFWTTAQVGGQQHIILVEAFERRVLTYNPDNPDPFKVEFGNVGQQYYRWRYGSTAP